MWLNKVDEYYIVKELNDVKSDLTELKRMLLEHIDKQVEFEKQVLREIGEIKASFVTKNGLAEMKGDISYELSDMYEKINDLEVTVTELKASSTGFREGQNWVLDNWDKIISLILALVIIAQYIFGR